MNDRTFITTITWRQSLTVADTDLVHDVIHDALGQYGFWPSDYWIGSGPFLGDDE